VDSKSGDQNTGVANITNKEAKRAIKNIVISTSGEFERIDHDWLPIDLALRRL
jgi:hypothetical protein